ncbi:MAG: hypothetical protein ACLFQV_05190 [Vulcanimicrobiota bacterium]
MAIINRYSPAIPTKNQCGKFHTLKKAADVVMKDESSGAKLEFRRRS